METIDQLQSFQFIFGGMDNTPEEVFELFPFLKECEFENAVVDISNKDFIVWKSGKFISGNWENGIWENGEWVNGEIEEIPIKKAPSIDNIKYLIKTIRNKDIEVSSHTDIEDIENDYLYLVARYIYKHITKIEDEDIPYLQIDYDYIHEQNLFSPLYIKLTKENSDIHKYLKTSKFISIKFLINLDEELREDTEYYSKKNVSLFINPKYKKYLTYKPVHTTLYEPLLKNKTIFTFNCYLKDNYTKLENIIEHFYRSKFKKIPSSKFFKTLQKDYIRKTLRNKNKLLNISSLFFIILNKKDYDTYEFLEDVAPKEKSVLIVDSVAHVDKYNEYFLPYLDHLPHEIINNWHNSLVSKFSKFARISLRAEEILSLSDEMKDELIMTSIHKNQLQPDIIFDRFSSNLGNEKIIYLENTTNLLNEK